MENMNLQLRGIVVRNLFKVALEKIKSQEEELNERRLLLERSKALANELLNPDLLVLVGLLEEQIRLSDNIKKLVEDVIDLDWSHDETPLQFESMKKCMEAMEIKNEELKKEANLFKEPSF